MANNNIFNIQAQNKSYYPFELAVAHGIVPEHSIERKYGRVTVPATGSYVDMWTGAASDVASRFCIFLVKN